MIGRSVKELLKPDNGILFSEKRISQRALAAKNGFQEKGNILQLKSIK